LPGTISKPTIGKQVDSKEEKQAEIGFAFMFLAGIYIAA
jgi:hypothetical protein